MNDNFIQETKKRQRDGLTKTEQKAYQSLVDSLFVKKLFGKEKAKGLGEYDGESLFGKTTLYPGCIYEFIYKAETPTKYEDGKIKFEYYDRLPMVLITHISPDGKNVRGINLNLCNYALRTIIINALHNIDQQFYNYECEKMAVNGKCPISNNVARVFLNIMTQRQFIQYIIKTCDLKNTDILYRQYSIDKIKDIRYIETWQHKYIPFLKYNGELRNDILQMIHKVCGIDKIKI